MVRCVNESFVPLSSYLNWLAPCKGAIPIVFLTQEFFMYGFVNNHIL